jgi:hypothetical protein
MKRIAVFSLIFGFIFASCDDSADVFEKWNSEPVISVFKNDAIFESLRDTLKIGFPRLYSFTIEDEESLTLTHVENDNLSVSIDNESSTITVDGYADGLHTLTIRCTDGFSRVSNLDMKVFCFSNWNPVASLNVSVIDGFEVLIDARSSYDADSRFGGGIVKYEYIINDVTYQSEKASLNYVYGSSGLKTVRLRVQDSDSVWSDWVTFYLNLG